MQFKVIQMLLSELLRQCHFIEQVNKLKILVLFLQRCIISQNVQYACVTTMSFFSKI